MFTIYISIKRNVRKNKIDDIGDRNGFMDFDGKLFFNGITD